MKEINFTKMVASGNDFVVISATRYLPDRQAGTLHAPRLKKLAQNICDRKYGVGADGLLVLEKSRIADARMRVFNADGSEAEMCGNGARCVALWACVERRAKSAKLKIETKAGIIESQVNCDNVKIKLTDPKNLKLNIPIKINNRTLHVNFINTGVPHTVVFVEGLKKIDVTGIGRQIRFHKKFAPAGTNADFAQVLSNNSVSLRTYERGVEDETFACGTGSVAAALVMSYELGVRGNRRINVHTKSKEILKVYFDQTGDKFRNVWLEGKARIVYKGAYNV